MQVIDDKPRGEEDYQCALRQRYPSYQVKIQYYNEAWKYLQYRYKWL